MSQTGYIEFSDETLRAFRNILSQYDKGVTNDGFIQRSELSEALGVLAVDMDYVKSNEDWLLDSVCDFFDTNGDGKLSVKEITDNLHAVQLFMSRETEQLTEAFKAIDKKKRGYVTEKCLLKVLSLKQNMTTEEAEATLRVLRKFDVNKDGKFSYPEFIRIYCSGYFPFKVPEDVEKVPINETYRMEHST